MQNPPLENIGDERLKMRNKNIDYESYAPPFFKGGICYLKILLHEFAS